MALAERDVYVLPASHKAAVSRRTALAYEKHSASKTDQNSLQLTALFHCLHTQRQQHRSSRESGCLVKAANICCKILIGRSKIVQAAAILGTYDAKVLQHSDELSKQPPLQSAAAKQIQVACS